MSNKILDSLDSQIDVISAEDTEISQIGAEIFICKFRKTGHNIGTIQNTPVGYQYFPFRDICLNRNCLTEISGFIEMLERKDK